MKINPIRSQIKYRIQYPSFGKADKEMSLARKYSIDTESLPVENSTGIKITPKEKELFVEKILDAHELAKINVENGNITGKGYATNLCTEENSWHLATNFNNSRSELSAVCGERSAILGAYNDLLKSKIANGNRNQTGLRIKYLMMASAKPIGEDKNAAHPCADCLSWLNSESLVSENTIVGSFKKDSKGKLCLELKSIGELLPKKAAILDLETINDNNKMRFSRKARISMEKQGYKEEELCNFARKTEKNLEQNKGCEYSNKRASAGVISNGEEFFAQKIDYSKRWFQEPVLFASAKAIEKQGEDTNISAICYFEDEGADGNYNNLINLASLGRLKTKYATEDTIIIIKEDGKITARTLEEFLPSESLYIHKYSNYSLG